MKIDFISVKTRIVHPPKDEIWDIIDSLQAADGDVIFITSKILAIHQGRTVKVGSITKEELIKSEATRYLRYTNKEDGYNVNLTISHGMLIPAAGIDESNADGYYVLWPEQIDELCQTIRTRIMQRLHLSRLGVVATDSHSTPLRRGVTGISIGLAGIEPIKDIRGEPDLFGRKMRITKIDMVDPLAAMAVNIMGESNECTPIVIVRGCHHLTFDDNASMKGFKIPPEIDLYRPLLDAIPPAK